MKHRRFIRVVVLVLGGLALAACARYSLVKPEQVSMGDVYTVAPTLSWNKATEGNTVIWTADGQMLQEIRFVNGLGDGDPLFEVRDFEKQEKLPRFKADMTALEVREFIESSIVHMGIVESKYSKFRPFKFGSADGFRFEFTLSTQSGLIKDGFVVGTIRNQKLYLIIYYGARLHYFPKYKDNVEALIRTIKFQ